MWTALILYCSLDTNICNTASTRILFPTEELCEESVGHGIAIIEGDGFVVQDWQCVSWGVEA